MFKKSSLFTNKMLFLLYLMCHRVKLTNTYTVFRIFYGVIISIRVCKIPENRQNSCVKFHDKVLIFVTKRAKDKPQRKYA